RCRRFDIEDEDVAEDQPSQVGGREGERRTVRGPRQPPVPDCWLHGTVNGFARRRECFDIPGADLVSIRSGLRQPLAVWRYRDGGALDVNIPGVCYHPGWLAIDRRCTRAGLRRLGSRQSGRGDEREQGEREKSSGHWWQ